jgi:enamine deaminase RidA (YjgF/YER057c/UK114 family)
MSHWEHTAPPHPTGLFEPWSRWGDLVFLAGQTNELGGQPTVAGRVPSQVSPEAARQAAAVCADNLLAALAAACDGDLTRVARCVQVRGFVNADEGFTGIPTVIDGASAVILAAFGESGRHARTAVGVAALPKGAVVEVDAVFALRPQESR